MLILWFDMQSFSTWKLHKENRPTSHIHHNNCPSPHQVIHLAHLPAIEQLFHVHKPHWIILSSGHQTSDNSLARRKKINRGITFSSWWSTLRDETTLQTAMKDWPEFGRKVLIREGAYRCWADIFWASERLCKKSSWLWLKQAFLYPRNGP